jgi:hypothetical protein
MSRPDYTQYPALAPLPPLVRQQRRLKAVIEPLDDLVDDEKTVRARIDALLLQAGMTNGSGVRCLGYDVLHHDRAGQTRLNAETLVAEFVAAGVDRELVDQVIVLATERGDPSAFATVTPAPDATVRVRSPRLPMAKAAGRPARRRG